MVAILKPKIEWTPVKKRVEDLIPLEENPRIMTLHMFNKLKQSILERGIFCLPIINTDNIIIAGHQRKQAFLELKIHEVHCMVPHKKLSDKDLIYACLESNKISGEWDWDLLANLFPREVLIDVGFTEPDIVNHEADLSGAESETEEEKKKDDKFIITVPSEESSNFESELDVFLKRFTKVKKKKK